MNEQITAIDVSNYFTNEAIHSKSPLTVMQALKLTYMAQGFHLALEDKAFFEEEIFAWQYGPVIIELYRHLKNISGPPPFVEKMQNNNIALFNNKQKDILAAVFKKYIKFTGWTLSNLTHAKGSPWEQCYREGEKCLIDKETITNYFKQIVDLETLAIILSEK